MIPIEGGSGQARSHGVTEISGHMICYAIFQVRLRLRLRLCLRRFVIFIHRHIVRGGGGCLPTTIGVMNALTLIYSL